MNDRPQRETDEQLIPLLQGEEKRRDVCVETEEIVRAPAEESPCPTKERQDDVAATLPDEDSERPTEAPRNQGGRREIARETVRREKLRGNRAGRKSVDRKQHCGDRVEDEKRGGSWWKDGGQTILQFFAKILGKRVGMGAEGATDRGVSAGGNKRLRERGVGQRVSRGDESRGRAGLDAGARLKRVGYIANHAHRYGQNDSARVRSQETTTVVSPSVTQMSAAGPRDSPAR